MGSSVTEKVLREYRKRGVEYPYTSKQLLMEVWGLDAKPFPGKKYVIGNDMGLIDPIKSPADALFSRGFYKIGGKVLPMMLSGSSWTQACYSVFHNAFIQRGAADDLLLALGDDLNLVTSSSTEQIFSPYIKVKGTDPIKNTKKILGQYSAFSTNEDPDGTEPAVVGIVPRVFKTLSSATKKASHWGDTLSNLPQQGKLELEHAPITEQAIQADMQILLPYMGWKGPRKELNSRLRSLWGHIATDIWKVLTRHNDELEYRILPEAEVTYED